MLGPRCLLSYHLTLLFAAASLRAQDTHSRVAGRVTDLNGAPLRGAEITVMERSTTASTDSLGFFVVESLPPGEYKLRVRRIGFRAQLLSLTVPSRQMKQLWIVLESGPQILPDVEVKGTQIKPAEYAYTHKYDDFFRRKRVGLGYYLTRDQIETRASFDTPRLLSWVPGVQIRFQSYNNADVVMRSCRSVGVWIDGAKQRYPDFYRRPRNKPDSLNIAVGNLLSRVLPSHVELLEVYRGPAEMPAEFLEDECAIVIWTK